MPVCYLHLQNSDLKLFNVQRFHGMIHKSLQVLPKNTAQLQADPEAHAFDLHFLCIVFEEIKK